jgi:Mrp family chromosome partitioning ATPase/capsular polysaccharide biosynthesis protein
LLFAAVAMGLTWNLLPEVMNPCTAYALLHIASTERKIAFDLPTANNSEFPTYRRMQAEWIKTRPVLQAALKQPHVSELSTVRAQSNPVPWLERDLKVDFPGDVEMLRISLSGTNPAELAFLVNAIMRAYLQEIVEKESAHKRQCLAEYQRIFEETEETLRTKREELRRLVGNLGTADAQALSLQQQLALEFYNTLRKHDSQISLDLMVAEVQAKVGEQTGLVAGARIPGAVIEERIDQDTLIKKHRQEMSRLEDIMRRYATYSAFGEQDPAIARYRKALKDAQGEERRRRSELRPAIVQRLVDEEREAQGQNLQGLKNRIALLTEEQNSLRKKLNAQFQEVKKFLGTASAELESAQTEIELKERIARHIGLQMEALRIEVQSPPRVQLVQEAEEPAPPSTSRQTKAVALAGMGTFVLVGFCTGLWEFRSQRLRSADDVGKVLGMRLLGTVPDLPRCTARALASNDAADDRQSYEMADAIEGIHMMMANALPLQGSHVIMVTSALAGEAKTTLACFLAASLARAGKATLLVDGNLTRPSIHHLLNVPLVPGLSDILRGEIEPVDGVRPLALAGLWVLSAGQWDRHVHAALAGRGLPRLFEQLKAGYDLVIIDSGPVLEATQSLCIGRHADAVILSTLRDVSHAPSVFAAYQRLAALGIRVLGTVFSKARGGDRYQALDPTESFAHASPL